MKKGIACKIASINQALQKPSSGLPPISMSAGAAFSAAGYSNDLFEAADRALYHTKNTLRGGCSVYPAAQTVV